MRSKKSPDRRHSPRMVACGDTFKHVNVEPGNGGLKMPDIAQSNKMDSGLRRNDDDLMNALPQSAAPLVGPDPLIIAGRAYTSRLLTGTGKYKHLEETRRATEAAGAQIVTVAIRRSNIGQHKDEPNLLEVLPPDRYTILRNTAGCYTAEDALRTCRLARELLDGHALVKLEVLGDQKTLFPDVIQTLKAAEILVAENFQVMVYTSDDPILAKRLEEIGCVAVMPLAAPIGSGLGT